MVLSARVGSVDQSRAGANGEVAVNLSDFDFADRTEGIP